jgi:hypothetical protein
MDIFTLDKEFYQNGEIVNDIDTILWVERYRQAGEFTITADATTQVKEQIPVGSLISHSDTLEMMYVENHEIDESNYEEKKLIITGRSVEAVVMENRVVMLNYSGLKEKAIDEDHDDTDILYILASQDVRAQVFNVVPIYDGNEIDPRERTIPFGELYKNVVDILSSFDGGIRTERPTPLGFHPTTMDWVVHTGNDVRPSVNFDWSSKDVEKARYLWSDKVYRQMAYVASQYIGVLIGNAGGVPSGWDLRLMYVDASDYNQWISPATNPTEYDAMVRTLEARGLDALGKQRYNTIVDATISKDSQWKYRTHYNMGDIVFVRGNYGISQPMRVTEYAESRDAKSGESGFPTLSALVDNV